MGAPTIEVPIFRTEEPTEEMAEVAAEVTPEAEVNWFTVEGKTGDNLTYLGNPDALVTIIDYSDFM